jgi:hypothetical protein
MGELLSLNADTLKAVFNRSFIRQNRATAGFYIAFQPELINAWTKSSAKVTIITDIEFEERADKDRFVLIALYECWNDEFEAYHLKEVYMQGITLPQRIEM